MDKWANRIASLVTFALLGRLLAPDAFGLVALAITVLVFFAAFNDGGAADSVVQRKDADRKLLDTAFWISTGLGLALAGTCFAIAPLAAALYDEPALTDVVRVLAVALALNGTTAVCNALLRRTFRFRLLAIRNLLATLAGAIAGVTWAIVSPSIWALVAQYAATTVTSFVFIWATGVYRPRFAIDRTEAGNVARFGAGILSIRFLTLLQSKGDYFVIGLLLGAEKLGYYVIGFRIFEIVLDLTTGAMNAIGLPMFSRMQDNPERMRAAILKVTRLGATVAIPLFAGMAALGDDLVPLVFGGKWTPSVPIMQWLAVVGIFLSVTYLDRSVMIATNRMRLESTITALAVLKNLVAFVVGAQFGITGVAAVYALSVVAFWPIRLWALRRATDLSLTTYVGQWLKPVAAGAVMVGTITGVRSIAPDALDLPLGMIVGAATYTGVLLLIGRSHVTEVIDIGNRILPARFTRTKHVDLRDDMSSTTPGQAS
jgi:O-antigen/teichoic acid export membrane protein